MEVRKPEVSKMEIVIQIHRNTQNSHNIVQTGGVIAPPRKADGVIYAVTDDAWPASLRRRAHYFDSLVTDTLADTW